MKPARCFLQMMEMENTHLQNYQDAISGLVKKSGLNFCMVWLRMVPGDTCKFTSMAVLCKASNFMTLSTTVIRLSGVQAGCKSHLSPWPLTLNLSKALSAQHVELLRIVVKISHPVPSLFTQQKDLHINPQGGRVHLSFFSWKPQRLFNKDVNVFLSVFLVNFRNYIKFLSCFVHMPWEKISSLTAKWRCLPLKHSGEVKVQNYASVMYLFF